MMRIASNALTNAAAINEAAQAWSRLEATVTITGATVTGKPVVNFSVKDGFNRPVIGLGNTTKAATALNASYPNLTFAIAKLVPGSNGSPSKWVSYLVTTVPNTATAVAAPTRPSTDNQGVLTDHGDGSYSYQFYRDITQAKAQVDGMTTTGAANNKAFLGDLTFDPNLTHRVSIVLFGNAPGTGSNTPTGANLGVQAVPLKKPVDVVWDFIPATGAPVTSADQKRDIVTNAACENCHRVLGGIPGASAEAAAAGFHGGSRNNVAYCVMCHTEQRKYGRSEATATTNGAVKTFTGSTYVIDGRTIGDLTDFIHRTHLGKKLSNNNYNYAGLLFNQVQHPQDIRNCTTCHDGSAGASNQTAQGNNWKNVPSVRACGSCHDGINFATGTGLKMRDAAAGLTVSAFAHPVGAQTDDSMCTLCHKADAIDLYHLPVTPPNMQSALHVAGGSANSHSAWIASNQARLPPGAIKVSYDVKSTARNADGKPVMVFRMLQDGARKDLNATTADELWDNFMGAPSVYFVYSVPQDGIAAPADFNASSSVYLKTLWKGTGTGGQAGTLTGPDADGYYTATLTGVTIPSQARMLTGGLGYSYNIVNSLPLTQTNVAGYPVSNSPVNHASGNKVGGLIVIAPNVQRVATGFTGRRAIVTEAKCNACHQELGAFTEDAFHGGQRNDATTCSWCHTPNRANGGWSVDSSAFIHAIHAAAKRTVPYNYYAKSATEGFYDIGYPGILNDCEACHVAGSYDFTATASANAVPNRQNRTVASGTYASTSATAYRFSPYVMTDVPYGNGFSFNAVTGVTTEAAATTLVTSPIATACFGCHDSKDAEAHYIINGGSIYAPRSTALNTTETCLICHGPGRIASIKDSHAK